MNIPLITLERYHLAIRNELDQAYSRVMNEGMFVLGSECEQFEGEVSQFLGVKYAIGVGNGLDALTLSLLSLGVGPGDDVLVPAHTFYATALAVIRVGARPVLVEPSDRFFLVGVESLERARTPQTKAIIPVHLYGMMCDMSEIMSWAKERGLFVVEDVAQAFGSKQNKSFAGSFGHINAFSFYPVKNLGALGDGGLVVTNDEGIAGRLKAIRNYGATEKGVFTDVGVNSRLDELQAAFLRVKLNDFERFSQDRNRVLNCYQRALIGRVDRTVFKKDEIANSFVMSHPSANSISKRLGKAGISTGKLYDKALCNQGALQYKYEATDEVKQASELMAEQNVALPLFYGMVEEEVRFVCESWLKGI